jgi:ATP-binding cassette subfamily F protein uup
MLLFDDGFADTPVRVLSGGERNRVQLAKLLRAGGNLLILDEPTNDLDLVTLAVLEEALVEWEGCALIVSHDRWFLDKVATSILAFEGDGRVGHYPGNCSDWLARPKSLTAPEVVRKPPAPAPAPTPMVVKARKISFKEKQELSGIEAAIEQAEQAVGELERTLQDPAVYAARATEVPTLVAELDERRRRVETLYARWQELEALARAQD